MQLRPCQQQSLLCSRDEHDDNEEDWLSPQKLIVQATSSEQEFTMPKKMVKSHHKRIKQVNKKTICAGYALQEDPLQDDRIIIAG